MKKLNGLFLVIAFTLLCIQTTLAQNSLQDDQAMKATEVQKIINSRKFVLKIEHVRPKSGKGYEFRISPDSLTAYLPDFNRARQVTDSINNNSLQFTSTNFAYNIGKDPKGNWDLTITPHELMMGIRQFKLNINQLGYATLNIIVAHETITYSGYIKQVGY